MGTTIHVERLPSGAPTKAVEICHSPDDGGYYLSSVDFQRSRQRVSADIYRTEDAARMNFQFDRVKWEDWY